MNEKPLLLHLILRAMHANWRVRVSTSTSKTDESIFVFEFRQDFLHTCFMLGVPSLQFRIFLVSSFKKKKI